MNYSATEMIENWCSRPLYGARFKFENSLLFSPLQGIFPERLVRRRRLPAVVSPALLPLIPEGTAPIRGFETVWSRLRLRKWRGRTTNLRTGRCRAEHRETFFTHCRSAHLSELVALARASRRAQ